MNPLTIEWVDKLEGYAVQFRYPRLSANKAEARVALSAAERICSFVRKNLGLQVDLK